ncbi:hypothetical protein NGM37_01810, partial [Streptomyces sp. TRM76130]|nr:hypothetical protein [Streptomyces sp. TRM76130]
MAKAMARETELAERHNWANRLVAVVPDGPRPSAVVRRHPAAAAASFPLLAICLSHQGAEHPAGPS